MEHVDEGTIHAWLDGALGAAESTRIEAHAAACAGCSAMVAEARGLIAASSRILTALDDVPGDVIPERPMRVAAAAAAAPIAAASPSPRAVPRRSWGTWRAAAAVLVMAGATGVILARRGGARAAAHPMATEGVAADSVVPASGPALDSVVAAPAVAAAAPAPPPAAPPGAVPTPSAAPAPAPALGAAGRRRGEITDRLAPKPAAAEPERRALMAPRPAGDTRAASVVPGAVVGRVTNEQGAPIPSASVALAGHPATASTNAAGTFALADVAAGADTLHVRGLGFAPRTVPVRVAAGDTVSVAIALTPQATQLSSAVATSAGVERSAGKAAERLVAGCYLAHTPLPGAFPDTLRLRDGGAGDGVRWSVDPGGVLHVTARDGRGRLTLHAAATGADWTGSVTRAGRTADATLTRLPDCDGR